MAVRRPPRSGPTSRRARPAEGRPRAGWPAPRRWRRPPPGTPRRHRPRAIPEEWIRSPASGPLHREGQRGQQGRGAPVAERERRGLPGHADLAVVVLHDTIEEQGQESAVDQPGRTLVGERKRDRPARPARRPPPSRTRGSTGCRPRCRRHGRGTPARRRTRPHRRGALHRPAPVPPVPPWPAPVRR